jgi:D-glycero-alpha-D-manno-heptose-7-phosphate kinase
MIISRSPLRISLGGGGTDLPSYYKQFEGFLIAAAIDKYVYVTANKRFSKGIALKYSQMEEVQDVSDIKHPIIRESLMMMGVNEANLEITTLADIPSGTGLGSSGSFTTALLKTLSTIKRTNISPDSLAEMACDIEINRLGEPIGKQDQYIASFGGICCFTFHKDHSVTVEPLKIKNNTLMDLEDNLMLFFTGYSRSASSILKDQNTKSQESNAEMLNNLHFVKEMGLKSKAALEGGRLLEFGQLMHEHWEHKKNRSKGMSNPQIDEWYELGLKNGALGGKVVGAGGGGFLMFYADNKNKLRSALEKAGLEEVRFSFDFEGTKTLAVS